jgi:hypothetical protein
MDQVGAIRELAMTTKELCDALRHTHPSRTMCKQAADEIERLARELAKAQLAPTCPDQTGGNSNAYYSNVAGAEASPSYQHTPISKCRGLD